MVEIVARVTRYQHRGRVLGLVSSGTSYGVFLNSLLVPAFVAANNWRGVWLTTGIITLAAGLAGVILFQQAGLLHRSGGQSGREPSSKTASRGLPTWQLIFTPWIALVSVMTFLNGFCLLPFQNYLSPYLREGLGLTVAFAADVWRTIGVIGTVAGFVVGWLSDKTGVRFALVMSYSCITAAALILAVVPLGVLPMIAGMLFALAFYPIFGLIPAYVSKVADGTTATAVFVVANVTLGIGGIVGNYAAGLLQSFAGTFVWIYVAIAVIAAGLAVLSVVLPKEAARLTQAGG
jgi:predicted MFS family arabinose efflux permease